MSFRITVAGGKSVRLPTAGKYCDRDIIVTAEGGGISLDVITASVLPDTVTDDQIVVITDTTPGTVYIDTDIPDSPVNGDLWVKLEAGADATIVLSEDPPYVRGGLAAAAQWNGSDWMYLTGHLGVEGAWVKFATAMPPIGSPLNDFTWEQISEIAASGKAEQYFSVGDAKKIIINGTVGSTTFSNVEVSAFIIGINHNSSVEGNNTIHFQIGKDDQNAALNLCLVDGKYNTSATGSNDFCMKYAATNTGGWKDSDMRQVVLCNTYAPTSPASGSLMAALPQDLREVMRSVKKYSDNTGGGQNTAAYVTETTDFLWLLAEYEVFGERSYGNTGESTYLKQYDYYAAGNTKVFNRHDERTTAAIWSLRSTHATNASYFCVATAGGDASAMRANNCYGVAPCFCV